MALPADALREPASRFIVHQPSTVPMIPSASEELPLVDRARDSVQDDTADFEFPARSLAATNSKRRAVPGTGGGMRFLNHGGGWPTKLWSRTSLRAERNQLWNRFGLHSLVTTVRESRGSQKTAIRSSNSGKARAVVFSLKGSRSG